MWEYKVEPFASDAYPSTVEEILNLRGKDNWELISQYQVNGVKVNFTYFIFKRPANDTTTNQQSDSPGTPATEEDPL